MFFLLWGLEKWSKNLGFKIFDGILSLLDFEFAARALLGLPSSFLSQLALLLVDWEKEYMKQNVGKIFDNMIQGSCISTDSVKSGDEDYFTFSRLNSAQAKCGHEPRI